MNAVDWRGEEPPILAIHGSAGHAYGLTALGEGLAPDVRFVAVDLRGHGFSDKPPTGYGVKEHVEDVLQLIDAIGLERPILLGHSIGGAIPTFAAEAAGDRVGGLVLFDAVVGDRRFVEGASFVVEAFGASLEQRFAAFDEYHGAGSPSPRTRPGDAGSNAATGWARCRCQTACCAGAACVRRSPLSGRRSRARTR